MIIDIINDFREKNGKKRDFCWNPIEDDNCLQHCLYMALAGKIEHTPDYFLKSKAEAIAMCNFRIDINTTVKYLIFEVINESNKHREVILNYDNLAFGVYVYNYKVYLTIRGW